VLAAAEFIAARPWRDLVVFTDYFGPASDLNLVDRVAYMGPDSGHVQVAEFLPFVNPRLRPLGDFVTRMAFTRIDHWLSLLKRLRDCCHAARGRGRDGDDSPAGRDEHVLRRLTGDVEALHHLCRGDPAFKLREACITLVQIYAAARPREGFSWLGLDLARCRHTGHLRHRVERQGDSTLTDQIAAALAEVAGLYRSEPDPEGQIRRACLEHDLVLVAGPGRREVYWRGQEVEADWFRQGAPWQFLLRLAERHGTGLGVDTFDTSDEGFSAKDARHRLKSFAPGGLMGAIIPAGCGTHKLGLPGGAACVLRFEQYDRLEEARGRRDTTPGGRDDGPAGPGGRPVRTA
jgi:hypothetical protein